jgi:hypothetical protein
MSEFKTPLTRATSRRSIPKREINSVLENPSATKKLAIADNTGTDSSAVAGNSVAIQVMKHPSSWYGYVAADKLIITLEISDSEFLRSTTEKMAKNPTQPNKVDNVSISTMTAPMYSKLSDNMYTNTITPDVHSLLYFGKIENISDEVSAFLEKNTTDRKIIIYTPSNNCIRALFPLRDRVTLVRTVVE